MSGSIDVSSNAGTDVVSPVCQHDVQLTETPTAVETDAPLNQQKNLEVSVSLNDSSSSSVVQRDVASCEKQDKQITSAIPVDCSSIQQRNCEATEQNVEGSFSQQQNVSVQLDVSPGKPELDVLVCKEQNKEAEICQIDTTANKLPNVESSISRTELPLSEYQKSETSFASNDDTSSVQLNTKRSDSKEVIPSGEEQNEEADICQIDTTANKLPNVESPISRTELPLSEYQKSETSFASNDDTSLNTERSDSKEAISPGEEHNQEAPFSEMNVATDKHYSEEDFISEINETQLVATPEERQNLEEAFCRMDDSANEHYNEEESVLKINNVLSLQKFDSDSESQQNIEESEDIVLSSEMQDMDASIPVSGDDDDDDDAVPELQILSVSQLDFDLSESQNDYDNDILVFSDSGSDEGNASIVDADEPAPWRNKSKVPLSPTPKCEESSKEQPSSTNIEPLTKLQPDEKLTCSQKPALTTVNKEKNEIWLTRRQKKYLQYFMKQEGKTREEGIKLVLKNTWNPEMAADERRKLEKRKRRQEKIALEKKGAMIKENPKEPRGTLIGWWQKQREQINAEKNDKRNKQPMISQNERNEGSTAQTSGRKQIKHPKTQNALPAQRGGLNPRGTNAQSSSSVNAQSKTSSRGRGGFAARGRTGSTSRREHGRLSPRRSPIRERRRSPLRNRSPMRVRSPLRGRRSPLRERDRRSPFREKDNRSAIGDRRSPARDMHKHSSYRDRSPCNRSLRSPPGHWSRESKVIESTKRSFETKNPYGFSRVEFVDRLMSIIPAEQPTNVPTTSYRNDPPLYEHARPPQKPTRQNETFDSYQVAIMGNAEGAPIDSVEAEMIQKMIISEIERLALERTYGAHNQLRFRGSGQMKSGWFLLSCQDEFTCNYILNWRALKEEYHVALALEAPWPFKVYVNIRQHEINMQRTLNLLAAQNYSLDFENWEFVGLEGQPGEFRLVFNLQHRTVKKLDESDWVLFYELTRLRVHRLESYESSRSMSISSESIHSESPERTY